MGGLAASVFVSTFVYLGQANTLCLQSSSLYTGKADSQKHPEKEAWALNC